MIDEMLELTDKEKNTGAVHAKFPYYIGQKQLGLLYRIVKILSQEGVPRDSK